MRISYDGHTYQANVTSVGNIAFSPSGAAMTVTWSGGGTQNTVMAMCITPTYHGYTYGPNVTSPYRVNVSGLADYTGGNYDIQANIVNMKISPFAGAYVGSYFSASAQDSDMY
jgi:hypothetical protein